MIENKCTQWYESERCTVKNLIEYIEKTGQMRDAQIEAIKVYLFLKIACECKPLTQLFRQGFFNSIDLNEIELSKSTREYLFQNPAAAALFEYACLTNDNGEQVSEKLEKQIKKDPTGIDYDEFFRNAFYGVSYTDYLFSLPMGAGKTYLMAAFIYLDLYFAYDEPTNPSFAHNFIIFAPSGLKSSVVPSLKTIQNFNPSWILPEPAATDIKRMISFEVLDQSKTAKKSNKTKNPNVQKIANHQPLSELFGLVAVTNAEKVILERIQEKQGQINMFEESEDDKDRQANELRNLIGKLPSLSIFIDEVHHAVSDEIKLRAVVTRWAQNHTVNSVIGFSGTPYLDKVEKIKVVDSLSIGTAEITNIVYYYPLIDGVGNFLRTSDMRCIIDSTKTSAGTRKLPITQDVANMFRAIIEDREAPKYEKIIDGYSGFLFVDKNGNPLVAMHWQHRLNHMVKRYNDIYRVQMPNITPHVCRHTYCSNMAKSGMNPKTLQYLMGHSDIAVTLNVYTHIGLDDATEELRKLEEMENARRELEKGQEKPVSQKMFKAI